MAKRDKLDKPARKRKKKGRTGKRAVVVRRRRRPPRSRGFGSQFPTNRIINSNQYWQLRAEIAGSEARVRQLEKDSVLRQEKAVAKVKKLKAQVGARARPIDADAEYSRIEERLRERDQQFAEEFQRAQKENSAKLDHLGDALAGRQDDLESAVGKVYNHIGLRDGEVDSGLVSSSARDLQKGGAFNVSGVSPMAPTIKTEPEPRATPADQAQLARADLIGSAGSAVFARTPVGVADRRLDVLLAKGSPAHQAGYRG